MYLPKAIYSPHKQGAQKPISAQVFFGAVVNQTVAGLAQGREICGNVVYLGGPLTFMDQLRAAFDKTIGVKGTLPEHSLYYVAIGAALLADSGIKLDDAISLMESFVPLGGYRSCLPLFDSPEDYEKFKERHARSSVDITGDTGYTGDAYIGIDAGSTTVKAVATDSDGNILCSEYLPNGGNPVPFVRNFILNFIRSFKMQKSVPAPLPATARI